MVFVAVGAPIGTLLAMRSHSIGDIGERLLRYRCSPMRPSAWLSSGRERAGGVRIHCGGPDLLPRSGSHSRSIPLKKCYATSTGRNRTTATR
jgi:hypothetical protein